MTSRIDDFLEIRPYVRAAMAFLWVLRWKADVEVGFQAADAVLEQLQADLESEEETE